MKKFLVLDTFRFLGAILVALGHFFFSMGVKNAVPNSYILVVEYFFVLSSFLFTLKQLQNIQIKKETYLENLFRVRIIRLLFPYTVIVLFYYIVVFKNLYPEAHISIYQFFINVFLLQGLGLNNDTIFTIRVAWFLGIELYMGTIYLYIIYLLKDKFEDKVFFLSLLICLISLSILKHYSPNFMEVHFEEIGIITFGIIRGLFSYSVGTMCAIVFDKVKDIDSKYRKVCYAFLEILIIFLIIKFYGKINYNRENEFIFPFIIGTLIVIFSHELGLISFLLKKFFVLGKLGYSIYLIHPIFLEIFFKYKIKNIYLYLLLTLFSSILFYYFIERRIIKLKYNMVYLKIRNQ